MRKNFKHKKLFMPARKAIYLINKSLKNLKSKSKNNRVNNIIILYNKISSSQEINNSKSV